MLEVLAIVVLTILMLVPLVNILTGLVGGFMMFGPIGGICGAAIGFAISKAVYSHMQNNY